MAVLIGPDYAFIASGGHDWENRLEAGLWTVLNVIDMVTTPTGRPLAMVHGNNCTSDPAISGTVV